MKNLLVQNDPHGDAGHREGTKRYDHCLFRYKPDSLHITDRKSLRSGNAQTFSALRTQTFSTHGEVTGRSTHTLDNPKISLNLSYH